MTKTDEMKDLTLWQSKNRLHLRIRPKYFGGF